MPTRNTGTAIRDAQGNNATKVHLATNILIKVDGLVLGAVKTFQLTEQRDISMISEIGTDGVIDSAPNRSTQITGSINRYRYDRKRLIEATNRGYIHVHSQRIPFDIEIQDIFADADESNALITIVEDVWFDNLTFTYNAEGFIIEESCNFKAERIYSQINGGNVITSVGNGNGAPLVLNAFEQQADRGAFTGALDQAGLLNAYMNENT